MKRYSIMDYHSPEMSEDKDGEWIKYEDAQMIINQLTNAIQRLKFDIENAQTALIGENKVINKFWGR